MSYCDVYVLNKTKTFLTFPTLPRNLVPRFLTFLDSAVACALWTMTDSTKVARLIVSKAKLAPIVVLWPNEKERR